MLFPTGEIFMWGKSSQCHLCHRQRDAREAGSRGKMTACQSDQAGSQCGLCSLSHAATPPLYITADE